MYRVQSYINTTFNIITNKEKTSSYKRIIHYVQLICLLIDKYAGKFILTFDSAQVNGKYSSSKTMINKSLLSKWLLLLSMDMQSNTNMFRGFVIVK